MSSKCALIFVLAALCCLVATEAATQRRNGAIRPVEAADETKNGIEVEAKREQELEEEEDKETDENNTLQLKQNHSGAVSKQDNLKETIVRPSNDDARARRVRRRRGPSRTRNSRRRRNGNNRRRRRGPNNRRRRGPSRRRNTIRRRGGRPLRG
ncbi:protein nemuri [Drosophila nasuta]|uniref:protein nemuri n=1 Tax=Drosophila nasuta TaxID=42062 RepID=UPI00295F060D|nr:protein nemuri [Drosophila nasuta]